SIGQTRVKLSGVPLPRRRDFALLARAIRASPDRIRHGGPATFPISRGRGANLRHGAPLCGDGYRRPGSRRLRPALRDDRRASPRSISVVVGLDWLVRQRLGPDAFLSFLADSLDGLLEVVDLQAQDRL